MVYDYSLIIRDARIYAPEELGVGDIAVSNGKIAAVGAHLPGVAEEEIDGSGLLAMPGILETHAHMLLPFGGTQTMNDFFDGTRAGAYGGVTTLIDFADQVKGGSILQAKDSRAALAKRQCATDFSFHCTLTDITEETLRAIPALIDEGFPSFKFYTAYKAGGLYVPYGDMERAFRVIAQHGGIATVHAEDEAIIDAAAGRLIQQGRTSCRYFQESRPADAEQSAIRTLISLARETGVKLLIRHVSSEGGAGLIEAAQKDGLEVYGETCPHYLYFDESIYEKDNAADYIVNPPIRTAADREGIWRVLAGESVFTIGTDDCAFYRSQKRISDQFCDIPGGMPGIEPRLVLLYELGVRSGRISMERLAEMTAANPAKLYGLWPVKGALRAGSDADIVLLNPNQDYILHADMLHEKTDYTPFEGVRLHSRVEKTIFHGRILVDGGQDYAIPGTGNLLKRGLPQTAGR